MAEQQLNFYQSRLIQDRPLDLNHNTYKPQSDISNPDNHYSHKQSGYLSPYNHVSLRRSQSAIPTPHTNGQTRTKYSVMPKHDELQKSTSLEPRLKQDKILKTHSEESVASVSGSSSATGSQCSSPGQLRSPARKQRASRESLQKFVNKHSKVGLTASLPTSLTERAATPYSEEWMKKKQYLSITKQHVVRDVKFDANCNIILTTKSSVQMYDNNGVFKEKLYTNRIGEPWGLHVNLENGHVFVSDFEDECVKEFNGLGIIVQEYGPVPTPCGVALSSYGYVFVCSQSEGCVYIFDKRAQLVTKIGKGVLTAPSYVALYRKSILVSDESRIVGFNIRDDIEFVYGQADGSKHPACLCVDNHTGYVLATSYYKDKLIAFNQNMERAVKIKQTTRPMICAISPYGNLLIGESSSNGTLLKMFRMK